MRYIYYYLCQKKQVSQICHYYSKMRAIFISIIDMKHMISNSVAYDFTADM